jgi:hypothetical protein
MWVSLENGSQKTTVSTWISMRHQMELSAIKSLYNLCFQIIF